MAVVASIAGRNLIHGFRGLGFRGRGQGLGRSVLGLGFRLVLRKNEGIGALYMPRKGFYRALIPGVWEHIRVQVLQSSARSMASGAVESSSPGLTTRCSRRGHR